MNIVFAVEQEPVWIVSAVCINSVDPLVTSLLCVGEDYDPDVQGIGDHGDISDSSPVSIARL